MGDFIFSDSFMNENWGRIRAVVFSVVFNNSLPKSQQ